MSMQQRGSELGYLKNKKMTRYFTFIYIVQQRRKLDDFHRPDIVATCGFKVEYEEVLKRTWYSSR